MENRVEIDPRYRSLLRKAVRRGNENLVLTFCAMLGYFRPDDVNYFRRRTAVITFEECWPLGQELIFNRKFHSKVAALIKVARSLKTKDAAGLAVLAHALSEGDKSVLEGSPGDRHIKIVASAIQRPEDFWHWTDSQTVSEKRRSLIENAYHYRNAGNTRVKAIVQAAAYLAAIGEIPEIKPAVSAEEQFPYWVVLDMHTSQGRRAIHDVARDLHIPRRQLELACYYFEGTVTNGSLDSKWWAKSRDWHFRNIGLPYEEAYLLWEPAMPQLKEALNEEGHELHKELYAWKLANLERVDYLKKQVDLFIEHFDKVQQDQIEIF